MSFAVIQTGGKQYKVSTSEILKIERLSDQEGKTVEFKNVLFLNDDKTTEIGNPNIQGARVEATILKNVKNKTILVFKKRRRKNSRKKYGHRQPISLVQITKIFSKDGKLISQSEPKKEKKLVKKEKLEPAKAEKVKDEKPARILKVTEKVKDDKTTRLLKAEETRKKQQEEAKRLDELEKKRLTEVQEKIKLQTKKSSPTKKKTINKKKPLTTKKK